MSLFDLIRARPGHTPPLRRRSDGVSPEECWHPAGARAIVAGRELDGLVYVGHGLEPASDRLYWLSTEPSLIDPTLPVGTAPRRADLDYVWPLSYEGLSPERRAAYLDWLAGGRTAPGIGAAYIDLFVSGLERRVLVDPAAGDLETVVAELERLVARYGEGLAGHRLRSLYDLLRAPSLEKRAAFLDPPATREGAEPPLELLFGLGAYAASGEPLPVEWALSWVRCSTVMWLRTPGVRCPDEFGELFALRYREHHGAGLRLRGLRSRFAVEHYPINSGIDGPVSYASNLPAVAEAVHAANPLRRLAEACTDELDSYSRYLGRNPEGADDLGAVAVLPRELLASRESALLDEARRLVAPLGAEETSLVDAEPFVRLFGAAAAKPAKKDAVALARLLAALGAGIEPDVRFGGDPPEAGGRVVLFRLEDGAADTPTAEYAAAAALLDLGAAVAGVDGRVTVEEERALAAHLAGAPNLRSHERARLAAHLDLLLARPPSLRGIKAHLRRLEGVEREAVAGALLAIAGADGAISAAEVELLHRLFQALGIEESVLYSELHALTAAPIVVRPARPGEPEYDLPPPVERGNIVLDHSVIAAKLADSAAAATLLAGIFVEDEPAPARAPSRTGGLDDAHRSFLARLGERPEWARDEVEAIAGELGLLTDGAVEICNDAAFDLAGDAAFLGDDPVEVDAEIVEQLLR